MDIEWVDRAAYNAFVQEVQAFAISAHLEHRIDVTYGTHEEADKMFAQVEVYWDGKWREVARESRAMTPECVRTIYPEEFDRLRYEVAGDFTR